jgi:hypothetical protein
LKYIYVNIVTYRKSSGMKKALDDVWLARKVAKMYGKGDEEVDPKLLEYAEYHVEEMEQNGFIMVMPNKQ